MIEDFDFCMGVGGTGKKWNCSCEFLFWEFWNNIGKVILLEIFVVKLNEFNESKIL